MILPIIINNPIVVQNCMKCHVTHCIMSNSHGYPNKRREDHDYNICFWLWKKKICQICQHTSTTTHAKIPTYLNTKGYSSVKCHSFLFLLPRLWWMMNCWDHWTDIVCTNKLVLCTQMKKFPISGFILVVGYQITNKISNVAPSPLHLSSKT